MGMTLGRRPCAKMTEKRAFGVSPGRTRNRGANSAADADIYPVTGSLVLFSRGRPFAARLPVDIGPRGRPTPTSTRVPSVNSIGVDPRGFHHFFTSPLVAIGGIELFFQFLSRASNSRGHSDCRMSTRVTIPMRSEEHTSELQSRFDLVC